MKKLLVVPVLILSLGFFSLAQADQITAIQTSPASPQQGGPVTVKLLGTGNCKNLDLSWGDGTLDLQYNPNFNLAFTIPTQHTYQNPGPYKIEIKNVAGCQGKGLSKTITVAFTAGGNTGGATAAGGGIIFNLCAKINCASLFPHIDYVVASSNFTPGGNIVVVGSGFGNSPGGLHMVGYGPLIPFKLPDNNVPGILSWKDTLIVATIPTAITGVVDQPVALYVLTANNAKSNYSLSVPFTAAREVRMIPFGDPAVSIVACGTDSNLDECNNWRDPDDSELGTPGFLGSGHTVFGNHMNCWGCFGDDTGQDTYQVNVANGWLLDQMYFTALPSDPGEASAELVTSLPPGANTWQPSVSWMVTSGDFVHYSVDVYIVGPKGVPYN